MPLDAPKDTASGEPLQFQLSEASDEKLTDWAHEPSLLTLKTDLEAVKPSQQAQVTRIQHWADLIAVTGKAKPPEVKGRSKVQPKLIRRQAEWRYSALTEPFLSSNKMFKVQPVTFEDTAAATQNELVLNWQFRTKLNRVKLIDEFVRSTVDEGTCIVRTGWKRITTQVTEQVPVFEHYELTDPSQAENLQQAIALKADNPRGFEEQADPAVKAAVTHFEETGQATVAQQVGMEAVQTEVPLINQPTLEVLDPRNVFIDPSCGGDLDKALFVIVSFETNKAELLKEGKRYKNLDRVNWSGSTPLTEPDHSTLTPSDFQLRDALRKRVVAYEYWGFYDIEGNGALTPFVATWIGNTLIRMEKNPFPDQKLPFVVVPYLPIKRALYGETDAELLEDNQAILGAVSRGMIDLLGKSANSQKGYRKGMLDALNRKRFEEGKDYEFNPDSNPERGGLIEHKYPELPQSALLMTQMQNQEAEALTGVKSFSGGLSGEAYGNVATGIRGVLDAASKREMAILRRLVRGMVEIGQKIISMNGEFLSDKEVVRVTNEKFVTISREDLQGSFDLEMDISTVEVDNAQSQDLAFMLQTIGPNSSPELAMKIMAKIADLKRIPDLAHELRNWKPEPTPEQQMMQQLELQKAQLEVQKLQSEVELNQAKAAQALAQKDQANLDYVEQESGTKHAREMAKQQAQAEGNQDLEITKALVKARKPEEKKPEIETAIGFNALTRQ